jgi:wobble nucleotide-excising tRNase
MEEVGRFVSFRHKAPHFGQLSLIFARNGYGKSTLCAVLRSATEQDAQQLSARKRLGSTRAPSVKTSWKMGGVAFNAGSWNACPGPVHIFDQEYVRRNLHVAESVTIDNRRSLVTVILGNEGVTLARKVSELDQRQRELSLKINSSERAITTAHNVISSVSAFVGAEVPEDIQSQIESAEKRLNLAKQHVEVKRRQDPKMMNVPVIEAIEALAARTLSDLTVAAEEKVAAHLNSHGMQKRGNAWIRFGIEHMKGNECPFCNQDTSGSALISAFKGVFSTEYAEFMDEIDASLKMMVDDFGENGAKFDAAIELSKADIEFWTRFCDLPALPDFFVDEQQAARSALISLMQLLEAKKAKPLERHTLTDRANVGSALEKLRQFYKALEVCLPDIREARETAAPAEIEKLNEIYKKKLALLAKLGEPLSSEVSAWRAATSERDAVDLEKSKAQISLKRYVESTVSARQDVINELLEAFGASFQLVDTKASFAGRQPNADYSISIGSYAIKASETSDDRPSFRTVLSAGDKFTLALAFFLAQVRATHDLASATVIFDDPFNSQDMQRQWETTSQLRLLSREACQVLIFSHDPRFLALIEKNDSARSTCFQLTCTDAGIGTLKPWSSTDELKEIYVRQAERIREYGNAGTFLDGVTAESLIKDLRPFMEDFLRARFPGRFARLVMLDGMTKCIEEAGKADPFYHHLPFLRALNEYTRDNMHAGASLPDPIQLRAQCKKIIKVMGSY